jgi:hypothetical protein
MKSYFFYFKFIFLILTLHFFFLLILQIHKKNIMVKPPQNDIQRSNYTSLLVKIIEKSQELHIK